MMRISAISGAILIAVILTSVTWMTGLPKVTAQPASEDEVLGVRIGPSLAESTVPSSGAMRTVSLARLAGQEVVIVVRGQFVYSQRPGFPLGRQDAKYRWGSRHPDRVCLPCTDPNLP